ncbi:hypothetical protein, partial [Cryobacterium sp. MLB-32]|uniref:hypothetical protein n=1 Tax=Cryobacterium sp. MLB-32 TaxID=1529318 RepID=UPI0012E01A47
MNVILVEFMLVGALWAARNLPRANTAVLAGMLRYIYQVATTETEREMADPTPNTGVFDRLLKDRII